MNTDILGNIELYMGKRVGMEGGEVGDSKRGEGPHNRSLFDFFPSSIVSICFRFYCWAHAGLACKEGERADFLTYSGAL